MICEKIVINADLSAAFLEDTAARLQFDPGPLRLFVSSSDINNAQELVRGRQITVYLDTNLPDCAWYIHGKYMGVYSPGAV